jgi:BolA protein
VSTRVERLRAALQSLNPTSLEIRDDSAKHAGHAGAREGGHFHVVIASAAFAGVPALERHRTN